MGRRQWILSTKETLVITVQYIHHKGANGKYLINVLNILNERKDIKLWVDSLGEYLTIGNRNVDVLLYQTFPDENNKKLNKKASEKTDSLFKSFQGLKILVDTHDNGDRDGFPRFNDRTMPRIKCFPSHRFMKEYNVVLKSTFNTEGERCSTEVFPDKYKRDIDINCKLGHKKIDFYEHRVREEVLRLLERDFPTTNIDWENGYFAFLDSLRRTKIAVACPGWGQWTNTHQLALRTGALLFCHDCFNDIHFLPNIDLIEGIDYISFNLFNFSDKLRWLLDHLEVVGEVGNNGRGSFILGYSPNISATKFRNYLKKELT